MLIKNFRPYAYSSFVTSKSTTSYPSSTNAFLVNNIALLTESDTGRNDVSVRNPTLILL
jgi:hypothetical protein